MKVIAFALPVHISSEKVPTDTVDSEFHPYDPVPTVNSILEISKPSAAVTVIVFWA